MDEPFKVQIPAGVFQLIFAAAQVIAEILAGKADVSGGSEAVAVVTADAEIQQTRSWVIFLNTVIPRIKIEVYPLDA